MKEYFNAKENADVVIDKINGEIAKEKAIYQKKYSELDQQRTDINEELAKVKAKCILEQTGYLYGDTSQHVKLFLNERSWALGVITGTEVIVEPETEVRFSLTISIYFNGYSETREDSGIQGRFVRTFDSTDKRIDYDVSDFKELSTWGDGLVICPYCGLVFYNKKGTQRMGYGQTCETCTKFEENFKKYTKSESSIRFQRKDSGKWYIRELCRMNNYEKTWLLRTYPAKRTCRDDITEEWVNPDELILVESCDHPDMEYIILKTQLDKLESEHRVIERIQQDIERHYSR
jgi:hypothetical protein